MMVKAANSVADPDDCQRLFLGARVFYTNPKP